VFGCVIGTFDRTGDDTAATRVVVASSLALSVLLPAANFATVTPTPPNPGASPSLAYRVILLENGFSMTMDDAFAFYGGAGACLEDVSVKGFVDYGRTSALVLRRPILRSG
jgi:hypothetical protein